MSALIGFAIGLATGFVMGIAAAIFLRPATQPTPEQRMVDRLRELTPTEPPAPKLPETIPDYDSTPIDIIRQNLRGLSLAGREAVRVYEEATLKRRGILNVLKALEEERMLEDEDRAIRQDRQAQDRAEERANGNA